MPDRIGCVSQARYEQLVAEARELVEQQTRAQFVIGDDALEIEPLRDHGGSPGGQDEVLSVDEALAMFAEDIGLSAVTVKKFRWVASRWPKEHRQTGVSFGVHRILADIHDDEQRWAKILDPPGTRTGEKRWTMDEARRVVGHQVTKPESVQEKINAIHVLARDEAVASRVAADLLRRPEIAHRTMADPTARHMVNRAQVERSQLAAAAREAIEPSPVTPVVRRIEHTIEFLDLVGTCQGFAATVGRVVPRLRERTLSADEKAVLHHNIDRVKATCEWLEVAVDTGRVNADEALRKLLRGE